MIVANINNKKRYWTKKELMFEIKKELEKEYETVINMFSQFYIVEEGILLFAKTTEYDTCDYGLVSLKQI